MAKKKHHKKPHHKRRVSGIGGGFGAALAGVAGAGLGVIAGRMVNNMINPSTAATASVSPTILGAAEAAAGAFIATKTKKPGAMGNIVRGLAVGFGGNGLMYALSSKGLGWLPATMGYGPDLMNRPNRAQLTGFRDVPKIGFPQPGVIGASDRAHVRRVAGVYG